MSDRDARFQGRGVARVEPPYKARLDLFSATARRWRARRSWTTTCACPRDAARDRSRRRRCCGATLGVFRPGATRSCLGGEALGDGRVRLRYRPLRRHRAALTDHGGPHRRGRAAAPGQAVERVVMTPGERTATRRPRPTAICAAFRELKLTRERLEEVEAFPPDIWQLAP
jgi:hypothetical protein